jgi:Fe-S cluster assembly ATP-binding protein
MLMLKIKNLSVKTNNIEILNNLNLHIKAGEIHVIMGTNGSGKSTLAKTIVGHPQFKASKGEILFEGQNILKLAPDKRARLGIFLSFQYPTEIPGVNNASFLRMAYNTHQKSQGHPALDPLEFEDLLQNKLKIANISEKYLDRAVNAGFSGGEKKKNEILQMAVLEPKLAILDEIDSGLDIDALKSVANSVNSLKNKNNAIILITHYQRILNYIKPDYVHVIHKGQIIKSGDKTLAHKLEKKGYEWLITNP